MGRHPTDPERAEALLHAAVHGDEAATSRYGCSARSLRNWRARAADPTDALSVVMRRYAAALEGVTGDEDAAARKRANSFADELRERVQQASDVILAKAKDINPHNPEASRAINDHVKTLLEHVAALDYIAALFNRSTASGTDEA